MLKTLCWKHHGKKVFGMKKLVALFLLLALGVCTLCPALAQAAYTAGTYTAQGQGHNGMVEVEVVFSDSAIESIRIVNHNETPGVSDVALERVPGGNRRLPIAGGRYGCGCNVLFPGCFGCVAAWRGAGGRDVEALKRLRLKRAFLRKPLRWKRMWSLSAAAAAGLAAGAARQAKAPA